MLKKHTVESLVNDHNMFKNTVKSQMHDHIMTWNNESHVQQMIKTFCLQCCAAHRSMFNA